MARISLLAVLFLFSMQVLPRGLDHLVLEDDSHKNFGHFSHIHINSESLAAHSHDAPVTRRPEDSHFAESQMTNDIQSEARDTRMAGNPERFQQDGVDDSFGNLRVSGMTPQLALDRGHDHDRDAVYLSPAGAAPLASGRIADHRSRIVTIALRWDLLVTPSDRPTRPGHARLASPPNPGLDVVPIYLQVRSFLI